MKKRKVIYAISLIAVIILNIFYVEYSVFLLLLLFVGVPALSWITLQIAAFGVGVNTRLVSEEKRIYSQVGVRFTGICTARWLKATGRAEESFCEESTKIQWTWDDNTSSIDVHHYGMVYIYIDKVKILDALQIFSRRKRIQKKYRIFCYPKRMYPMQDIVEKMEVAKETSYSNARQGEADTEIAEIREYRQGDVIHRMHWKLSAAKDEYFVKEYMYYTDNPNYIFVDLQCDGSDSSRYALDKIYQAADAIGSYYIQNEQNIVFVVWNPEYDRLEKLKVYSDESLVDAVKMIMTVPVCESSGQIAYQIYQEQKSYEENAVSVYLTATKDKIEQCITFDVQEMKIKTMIEYLYQLYG